MSEEEELAEIEIVESAPQEEEASEPEAQAEEKQEEAQADESTETEEKDSASDDDKTSEDPKVLAQGRINKLIAKKYELEGTIAQQAEQLKKYQEQEASGLKEPSLEDLNYDNEAYKKALIEYGESLGKQEQSTGASQPEPVLSEEVVAFTQATEAFKAETPDYVDVVSTMPIEQHGVEALVAVGDPKVTYYLGTHLDQLDEINRLSPAAATLRIQQISKKLGPVEPKLSKAPDPIQAVASGGATITKKLEEMSIEELDAYEEKMHRG